MLILLVIKLILVVWHTSRNICTSPFVALFYFGCVANIYVLLLWHNLLIYCRFVYQMKFKVFDEAYMLL